MNSKFIRSLFLVGFLVASPAWGIAQEGVPAGTMMDPPPGPVMIGTGGGVQGFQFVSGDPSISTHVVKGAPYSLEAVIESGQRLSDGNRIVHRQTVHLYRDSKGRTRREETLAAIGPWAASGTPPTMITIQDPVSGVNYFLDPQRKIASKIPSMPKGKSLTVSGDSGSGLATTSVTFGPIITETSVGEGQESVFGVSTEPSGQDPRSEEKSEPLGKETIAGLSAEGARTTTTIPANTIGNERPLDIVRERWYSPDLQIVLRSKQTDPRFGETTYEVKVVDRQEPAAPLFEIPSDYKVREAESPVFIKHAKDPK
jgi:hypothetical protein